MPVWTYKKVVPATAPTMKPVSRQGLRCSSAAPTTTTVRKEERYLQSEREEDIPLSSR